MVAGLAARPRESSRNLPDTCVVVSHAVYAAGNLRPFESREFLFSQCVEGLFCQDLSVALDTQTGGLCILQFCSRILKFSGANHQIGDFRIESNLRTGGFPY